MTQAFGEVRAQVRAQTRAMIRTSYTGKPPVSPPHVGAWLYQRGFTADGLRLEDCERTGTVRPVQPGRCEAFNGTNQYITIAHNTAFNFGTGSWTVCGWIYRTTSGAFQVVVGKGAGALPGWRLFINSSNNMQIFWGNDAQTYGGSGTGAPIPANTWMFFAAGVDAATSKVFYRINATLYEITETIQSVGGTQQLAIGADSSAAYPFGGRLWDLRIYNRRLSVSELDALAAKQIGPLDTIGHWWLEDKASTRIHDSSGNARHGTAQNWTGAMDYEGSDVPSSAANDYGWSSKGALLSGVILSPKDFASANWTKRGTCTVTPNVEYAPNNQLEADLVAALGAPGVNDIYNANYAGALGLTGKLLSRQLWVKRKSTSGTLRIQDSQASGGVVDVNLATIGAGWVLIDPANLPNGASYNTANAAMATSGGGMLISAPVGGPLDVYLWDANCYDGCRIPRNDANQTQDVLGNSLQYQGPAPRQPILKQSNCWTGDGVNRHGRAGTGTWSTDGTQAMSVKFWAKIGGAGIIISNQLSAPTITGWGVYVDGTGKLYWTQYGDYSLSQRLEVSTSPGYLDGLWHYWEITYDGTRSSSSVIIKVDGVRVATTSSGTLAVSSASASAISCIGSRNGDSVFFNGSVCGVELTIGATSWIYPLAEGGTSTTSYNRVTNANHISWQNYALAQWATKQDVYHFNLLNGFTLSGGNRIPQATALVFDALGNPLTNPAGKWHNNAETVFDFTSGQPLDPILNGITTPTAHAFGVAETKLTFQNVPGLRENKYLLTI